MARQFITEKERKFAQNIRSEIDEDIIRQKLLYYKINLQKSQIDRIYGEITRKVADQPVEFYARCLWEEPTQTFEGATADTTYSMEVYCDPDQLERRGIVTKAGDVLERDGEFFEILSSVQTMPAFGQIDNKIEQRLMVRSCREDYFVRPEHPVDEPKDKYSGSGNPEIPTSESYVGQGKEIVFPE